MTINVSPSLVFNGQAREAFEFYRSVFGGELSLNEFGPMGQEAGFPPDAIMHAQLVTAAGWSLMGDDSTKPGDEVVRGGSTIMVWGDDQATLEQQFAKLADGGTVGTQLEKQFWGDTYGDLTDKYGIGWGFNIGPARDA